MLHLIILDSLKVLFVDANIAIVKCLKGSKLVVGKVVVNGDGYLNMKCCS